MVDARSDPPYGPYSPVIPLISGNPVTKYFFAIKLPSMALDPVSASAGMTYPCRDDGIVEFWFGFQIGASKIPNSCFYRSEAKPR